ncbi:MAG: hypothetical protein WC681_12680 [Sterolibacterium sp.]|jgi:hypothetical protein
MSETNTAAATARNLGILTSELATYASRMKYLAMAASSIASGSTPADGLERENCVAYLLDTLEYLGDMVEGAAQNLEHATSKAFEGGVV